MEKLNKLAELAEELGGESWGYRRTTPYSRGYITGNDGRTIVQTTSGEVPANVCRFIEMANPGTILAIAEAFRLLASENAVRGEIIERLIGHYSAAGYHAVQNSLNPAQSLLYDAIQVIKQPATDAYLNSVRAEGADKVAEYHFVRIDALKEVSRQGHLFHKAAYSDAVNVASLFRAGKDGE